MDQIEIVATCECGSSGTITDDVSRNEMPGPDRLVQVKRTCKLTRKLLSGTGLITQGSLDIMTRLGRTRG